MQLEFRLYWRRQSPNEDLRMKHRLLLAVLILLFSSCGSGDKPAESDKAATADKSETAATADKSDAVVLPPESEPAALAAERIKEIQDEYNQARSDFMVEYRAADSDEARKKLVDTKFPKPNEYSDRILTILDEGVDKDIEFEALFWLSTSIRSESATDRLFKDHAKNQEMHKLCLGMIYSPPNQENKDRLQMLISESPHRQVKGWATFALASYLARNGEVDEHVESLFNSAIDEFGDIEFRGKRTLGDMAKAALFEAKNLVVGKEAPDIEGVDLDGKEFKLSDYRGKVVMLDFWGDW